MEERERTFEQAISRLESIVDDMENGNMTLDESIALFQEGMELSGYLNKKLDEVEKKITILIEDQHGNITEEVFLDDKESI